MLRADENQKYPGTFNVYDVDSSGSGPRVAGIFPERESHFPVAKQIAALVNAEAELLATLDASLEFISVALKLNVDVPGFDPETHATVKKIRAAIAKVKGGAS